MTKPDPAYGGELSAKELAEAMKAERDAIRADRDKLRDIVVELADALERRLPEVDYALVALARAAVKP